jgi:uncharacterized protein (DUF1697 family)
MSVLKPAWSADKMDAGEIHQMKTYISLFRGINVGGRHILPMKELVALLEELGCRNVQTYIQSGNAVFESKINNISQLSKKISAEIKKRRGFEPYVLLLNLEDLEKAIMNNPFPEGENDPQGLHVGFLASIPKTPDLKTLETLRKNSERFHLVDHIFYLYAPEGVGRSKLAANTERLLGVPMTDRNWATVRKIMELAKALNG